MIEPTPLPSLKKISAELVKDGFDKSFIFENNTLTCRETNKRYQPNELKIKKHFRDEGQSDPDDMSVLYAIEAYDGARGTITDAFGPYADAKLGNFLKQIKSEEVN